MRRILQGSTFRTNLRHAGKKGQSWFLVLKLTARRRNEVSTVIFRSRCFRQNTEGRKKKKKKKKKKITRKTLTELAQPRGDDYMTGKRRRDEIDISAIPIEAGRVSRVTVELRQRGEATWAVVGWWGKLSNRKKNL